jgi:ribosomal protein L7/L12
MTMTARENSSLTLNAWEESVRQFYIEGFRQHYENQRQASSKDLELWEFLEAQGIEIQDDIVIEFFINVNDLGWMKEPRNRVEIPQAVLDAYDFYDVSNCQIKASRSPVQERDTYAVRVGTPGEGGWLEIFDGQGKLLGSALTICDVVGWEPQSIIRERFRLRGTLSDWELSHWSRLRALSTVYPPRRNTLAQKVDQGEWIVLLESYPPENAIEIMKLIRQISGMGLAEVKRMLESLPHLVTKPRSREQAESIRNQLQEVGAQASIQEREWSVDN